MGCKNFFIALLVTASIGCNGPTKNEGIIQDSVSVSDSFAAKIDWAKIHNDTPRVIQIDTLFVLRDSVRKDNMVNKDTGVLAPSLGIDIKGKHPTEVMSFAETLAGIKYVYGSINPNVGFDCSGFITYVFNHFGIQVPRSSIDFTNVGKQVPVENAKRGDIILFTGTNPAERHVGHMGLITESRDTLRFIHATSGKAMSVTTTPLSKYYMSRFVKVIRIFPQNDR
jgi:cell wall-associated NlpC family hydrolase